MAIRIVLIQHYLALYKNGVGFLWNIKYIFQNCSLQLISQKTLQRVKLLLTIEDTGRPGGAGMAPRPCNFRNSLFTAKKAGPQIACHHGEKDEPERPHTLGPERPQAADLKKSRQSGVFMPPPPTRPINGISTVWTRTLGSLCTPHSPAGTGWARCPLTSHPAISLPDAVPEFLVPPPHPV